MPGHLLSHVGVIELVHRHVETAQTLAPRARGVDLPVERHGDEHRLAVVDWRVVSDVVEQAVERGLRHLWMQPGAESDDAVRRAEEAGIDVIHGGPCLLVVLGYREGS